MFGINNKNLDCLTICFFSFIIFILGFYFYTFYGNIVSEGFQNNKSCPDMLIQRYDKIYLLNSKEPKVPGVNPIVFKNLEEYVDYLNWAKASGNNCPALTLKHEYDTQGNEMYRIRPSLTELEGGLQETSLGELENDKKNYLIESELLYKRTFNDNLPLELDSKYDDDK